MVKRNNRKSYSFIGTIIIVAFLDQITKFLITNKLLNIAFITNTGSIFGLFQGYTNALVWLSIMIIGIFIYNHSKIEKSDILVRLSSGMIVGGIIGNLIDRVMYGAVIDFIDLGIWPLFNIADTSITLGVIMLIISLMMDGQAED